MRLLILSQYFPPETGAPQNRLMGLATQLQNKGIEVVVLTSMPNYPQMKIHDSYVGKKYMTENISGVEVHRSWIYVSNNRSIFSRLLNYFSFVFSAIFYNGKIKGNFDYVLCESPPLFLGISGWWIAKRKKSKLIFNVSDLWPESAEKLGLVTNKFLLRMASRLEEFLYRKSYLVTGQTQGIVKNISDRFPGKKVYWLPNGIDLENIPSSISTNWRSENNFAQDDFIILYSGIIGYAQGLDVILHSAKELEKTSTIKFVLLGDGPEQRRLLDLKVQLKLKNVFFHEVVKKDKLFEIISTCNAAVIPLKRLNLFKGAIPSKIFEQLAFGKPILLGVEGEAKSLFIEEGKCGLSFTPEDAHNLSEKVMELYQQPILQEELGLNGKKYVAEKFSRTKIATAFLEQLK